MTYFFIFLTPFISLALFELFFFRASLFYLAAILLGAWIVLAVKQVTGRKILDKELWNVSLLPLLLSSALAAYSILLVRGAATQLLFLADAIFLGYYLKNVYRGASQEFLENISASGSFLTVFFLFAAAYGLKVFLGIQIWVLILIMGAAVFLCAYQLFWASKIEWQKQSSYLLLICLVLTQLGWALYFLPFNYNFLGLILAICFYLLVGLVRPFLRGNLTAKTVKLYLFFGLASLAVIFLAAKWT